MPTYVGSASSSDDFSPYAAPLSGVAGKQVGDLAIVTVGCRGSVTITPPAGYQLIGQAQSTKLTLAVFAGAWDGGSDPSFTGASYGFAEVSVFRSAALVATSLQTQIQADGGPITFAGAAIGAGSIDWVSSIADDSSGSPPPYPTISAVTANNTASIISGSTTPVGSRTGHLITSTAGTSPSVSVSFTGASNIGAVRFSIGNSAPNASTLTTPPNDATVDLGVTNRLGWTFSDPDPGDSQSKFDLQWWDLDTGGSRVGAAHTVTQSVPTQFWDAPAGTFTAGRKEWQVRTYDAQGVVGPYSASSFFTAGNAPGGPTITAPINGATVGTTDTLTWSTPSQSAYQVRRVADNAGTADTATVYWDSGAITDATTRSIQVAFPTNNRWEHVQVRVMDGGLWGPWGDVRVMVSWTPPAVATVALTTYANPPTIAVAVTNPQPGAGEPTVSYNDIWLSAGGTSWRAATMVLPNSTWTFWTPASGVDYTVQVVSVASNGTTSTTAWVGAADQGLDYSYGGGYA